MSSTATIDFLATLNPWEIFGFIFGLALLLTLIIIISKSGEKPL